MAPIFPGKFGVSWPFGSRAEVQNRFSRWRPSWISDLNDFSCCFIYKSLRCFLPSFKSTGLSVQEKKQKIDFQDGGHNGHFGFLIETILAIFDLQVTRMLPTKFQVNWHFGSGGEGKNRFSRWLLQLPSWISNRKDFNYFWSSSQPDVSYQVSSQLAYRFRRKSQK